MPPASSAPNRIDAMFAGLRARKAAALMPFVCGGYPHRQTTPEVLPALERAGASIVEVGIPFSDPIADGPVIAAAMHEALKSRITPMEVFDQVAQVRARVGLGLVAMCSVSIVQRMGGPAGFCRQAAAAGFDGILVPDAPLEEFGPIGEAARAAGLTASLLVAPTTPPDRIRAIAAVSSGFIYLLARTGITGERGDAPEVAGMVAAVRAVTDLPIACGFGISTAGHIRAVVGSPAERGPGGGGADAAIVGSAMVRRMGEAAAAGGDPVAAAERFARELAAGLAG